ncbi:MAG: S-layer homology domain-containing protein [Actinomycetota bacterium]
MAPRGLLRVASVVVAMVTLTPSVADATVERVPDRVGESGLRLLGTADDGAMVPSVDASGRFVVFHTQQGFVVPGDTNGFADVFVRDLDGDALALISKPVDTQSDGDSSFADISADGRWVVFHSEATNLVAGDDENEAWDVFRHDRASGVTVRVSDTHTAAQANGSSFHPSISDDGRYVAFHSLADNLSALDTDADADVYVKDMETGVVELISVGRNNVNSDGESFVPDISGDARYVAFESSSTNLITADSNAKYDVFVRDRQNATTERVSLSAELLDADDNSFLPQISADGRYVAFESFAGNLIVGDTNGVPDVYLFDRTLVQTVRVSVPYGVGDDANDRSLGVSLSDDGTIVAFQSWASNLVPDDTNEGLDVFLYTVGDTAPQRISTRDGDGGDARSALPVVSGDGSVVVFESLASNLSDNDVDGFWDTYVYDIDGDFLAAASPVGVSESADVWTLDTTNHFDDVHWDTYYYAGVSFLFGNGITRGTSPTTYAPDAAVTRGQMATFLFRMGGSQWTLAETPFTDNYGGVFFYEPVKWAYEVGLTTGTSSTTFSPWDSVTRAQMAVFLWRMAGEPAPTEPHGFADVVAGSFYETAVQWLRESGITTGTSATTFSPNNAVTRGQMAAFLERLAVDYGWTPTWAPVEA